MARKSIIIDKNDWQELFDGFCDEANTKIRKRVNYQTFRRLKKGPLSKEAQITFDGDNVEIYDVNEIGTMWFDMFSGTKNDGSFGSYLFDFFQEELKNMHNEEEKKYDIWGLADAASCSACATRATDESVTTTTWAGDMYSTHADAASVYSTTIYDMTNDKIKELEEIVHHLQENVAQKADIEQVDYYVEQLQREMGDVHMYVDENSMRIEDLEYAEKQRRLKVEDTVPQVQSTSSIPGHYFKTDIASCEGSINRKEKENMDTNKMFANFEFGPVDDRIKMSPYGMAIRNADGRYVSYDAKNGNIMDVEVFNFDNHKLIWKMPVAVSAIAVGDTVIHMKKPMFVTSITNGITVIDIFNGEVKTIVPAQNMFGFNFVTKVVSLFNFTGDNTPTAENPFGNVMPFMLMGNEDMDMKDFFMMMAVANGGNMNAMFQNPFMLYAMMSDNENMKEMLPFMLMGQTGMFGQAPAQHQCNCGQHCQ